MMRSPRKRYPQRRPSVGWLLVLVLGFSLLCGWVLALAQPASVAAAQSTGDTIGTVDAVPKDLQLAQEVYLAKCATCHNGIPPAVLPTETWQAILEDSNHYGIPWEPLRNPELALSWKYLRTYSRTLNPNETVPYRIEKSRYFKILHPGVEISIPITLNQCASCHPGAVQFNYRTLSATESEG